MHDGLLVGRVAADANADDGPIEVMAEKSRQQAAMRARTARPQHDAVEVHADLETLRHQLLCAGHIAQTAERIGAAAGHHIGLASNCSQFVCHALHCRGHVGARGYHGDLLDAHQPEQKVVAAALRVVAAGHALLDDEAAFQAFLDRCGQRDAAVVGLRRTAGHQRVGALGQRIGHQELKLAGFVTARKKSQQVVALDPDLGTAPARAGRGQCGRKARHGFEWRGMGGVAAARETGQVHVDPQ